MFVPLKFVFAAFLTTIYIFVFVATIFLLSPVFLLRFLLGKMVKYINPELDSLLTPASTLLHQPRMNIVIKFTIKGELTVEEMRERFLSKAISCKDLNGNLKYPELQQSVYKWCGFLFWRWDRKFRIENHIKNFENKDNNLFADVDGLCQYLEETSMSDDKSPWEMLLINNKQFLSSHAAANNCFVIFRLRHSLADGHSIMKLLYGTLAGQSLENMPKSSIINVQEGLLDKFRKWIHVLYYYIWKSFELFQNPVKFFDVSDWHKWQSLDKEHFNYCVLTPISMKKAKEIGRRHGVCVPSLIISIVAGALRKTLSAEQNEINNIPEEIRICYPIPLKGHPDRLTNHFIMAEISIPIGEPDSHIRLQKIKKNVDRLKSGPVPLMMRIFAEIFGRLFYSMGMWITRVRWVTMCLSNFPTPGNLVLFGRDVSGFSFINGIPNGNTGVIISCIGYNDHLQMIVQIENSLASTHQVSLMSAYIREELETLSNH